MRVIYKNQSSRWPTKKTTPAVTPEKVIFTPNNRSPYLDALVMRFAYLDMQAEAMKQARTTADGAATSRRDTRRARRRADACLRRVEKLRDLPGIVSFANKEARLIHADIAYGLGLLAANNYLQPYGPTPETRYTNASNAIRYQERQPGGRHRFNGQSPVIRSESPNLALLTLEC